MNQSTPLLKEGHNCWRTEPAERFSFIVDAADYFVAARKAMLKARHSIYLIGWDFDARIQLGDCTDDGPRPLGDFIIWLAERTPTLEIRLLRWDTGAFKAMFRGRTWLTLMRWKFHRQITLKLDGAHPLAGSHHQKIVVIDDCMAFCGGIDMTLGRWDKRSHLDDDPERVAPDGTLLKPWHDATSAFDGAAARAVAELARQRWFAATGEAVPAEVDLHDCWPEGLPPTFQDIRLAIARTIPEMPDREPIFEIEQMYIDLVSRAKKWIYAESQYFASRRVAHAIARRLIEENGPEIVIVNPVSAEGWIEPIAMDSARARLVEALQRVDKYGRFRVYHALTNGGNEIYIHAKVTIVDDTYLRLGSSNFNNRSLKLDTECDVILAADESGNEAISDKIIEIMHDLIAEHAGLAAADIARRFEETGSLIATIETLCENAEGRRRFASFKMPELGAVKEWLADNEILDPEGPDAIFEPLSRRGLFKGWRWPRPLSARSTQTAT
ncbi:MAG: phospholipase [Rhodospirillales bacterium]|nr:phospholipase [Rhodospirillales bacterium]